MFGDFFNRIYYGDPRKPDYKKEDLEMNRFKLFFTVLQIRIWQLVTLNLFYSIFWLPVFFIAYSTGRIVEQTGEAIPIIMFLILIPFLVLTGPATAGLTYVIRKWARDEHAWVWSDFMEGLKQNWKESMLLMLINGVVLTVIVNNISFYSARINESLFFEILMYFMVMLGLLYSVMNMFIFPMLVTYKLTVKQILMNSFIFAMLKLPITLLVFVVAVGLFLLSTMVLVYIPMLIIGFTLPALIIISYTNWLFDKYINNRMINSEE